VTRVLVLVLVLEGQVLVLVLVLVALVLATSLVDRALSLLDFLRHESRARMFINKTLSVFGVMFSEFCIRIV